MSAGSLESREQSKHNPSHKCDAEGKEQNATVELEIVKERRERNSADRIERGQNRNEPVCEKDSANAPDQREQNVFDQKLAKNLPAPCAERASNRELALTRDAAGQLQVRDVRAANQKQKSDAGHEREERFADVTFQISETFLTKRQ